MMPVTYVRGKITMPQLPGRFIVSDRSKKLAASIAGKKAVFVTAPSGYGKTTFMIFSLSLITENNARVCWYHFDEGDTDLSLFYANLIESLFPSGDPQWKSIRSTLDEFSEYPSQYRYVNAAICQELWADCHCSQKVFLVFDDYQNVIKSPEIAETLSYFIDNFPPSSAILVSSRERPDLVYGKYSLNDTVVEISLNDLCFSEDEISDLFKEFYQSEVEKSIVERVHRKTSGWKAGVILISQMISPENMSEIHSMLEKPFQGTRLFDYFATEVIKNIDPGLMMFLLKVCILRDFTTDEVEELLHMSNTRCFITECEKRGLFIQKAVRSEETYSFHTLFREALLLLQKEHIPESEINELHFNAAIYYRRKKEYSRSIEHFILSKNTGAAIALIESEGVDFLFLEAYAQLNAWISLLPEDIVERNPNLLFIKGYINIRDKTRQSLTLIERASKKYEENDNYVMQLKLLITLVNLCTSSYERFDKVLGYSKQALLILKRMRESAERDDYRRFFLFLILVSREKYQKALEIALSLKQRDPSYELYWELLMVSGDVACTLGNFSLAEALAKEALENTLSKKVEMYRGFTLTIYSMALCMKNDAEADLIGNELTTLGIKNNVDFFTGFAARSAAFHYYSSNHLKNALDMLEKSIKGFEAEEVAVLAINNRLCSLLWRLDDECDKEKSYREAYILFTQMPGLHPGSCHFEICESLMGAIARECGKTKEAEELLTHSYKSSESKGAKHIMCGTLLHLTRLYLDGGLFDKAEELLATAISIASAENYLIFWDMQLSTMIRVLVYCVKLGIYAGHAEKMISLYLGEDAAIYAVNKLSSVKLCLVKDFSEKLFLRYAGKEEIKASVNIRIRLFGKYEVSVNGNSIPPERWKTKKARSLFQYLVFRKGTVVSREHLMELFWPESEKKNAATSLNTALYDLKKVLKEFGIRTDGIFGLVKENPNGIFINQKIDMALDVDEFRKTFNEYKKLKKTLADKKQVKKTLKHLAEVYSDGFLPDSMTSEWAIEAREEFDGIFIEISKILAFLYLEDKEYDAAEALLLKALELDPYDEELCLDIMNMYVLSGGRTRAIKFYQEFEKRLIEDLNVKPGLKIEELIRDIRK